MAQTYCFGIFELRPDGTLLREGRVVDLPPKQRGLLQILADATGRIVSKREILDRLWPMEHVSEASLTTCVRGLRLALDDLGRRGGCLETVHGQGYRFHAAVRPAPQAPAAPEARVRVAVAPFACQGATRRYLAEGLASEVSGGLDRWRDEGVEAIATSSARRQRRDPLDSARQAGLDFLITGRVWSSATEVRVAVDLLRVESRLSIWSAEFGCPTSASGLLVAEIAEAIAKQLLARAGAAFAARPIPPLSRDPRAYHALLRGFFVSQYRDESGLRRGIACFEQAVAWDPACAAAHASLAEAWLHLAYRGYTAPMEILPLARRSLARALEIDSASGLAHAARAFLAALVQGDLRTADEAIAIAERDPSARDRSAFLSATVHMAAGRTPEALRALDAGRNVDSLSPNLAMTRAGVLFFAERYEEALTALRVLTEAEPDFPAPHALRADVACLLGRREEALRCAERADALGRGDQMTRTACAWAFGQAGRPEAARAILDALERRARTRYVSPGFMAVAYAGLGDGESAAHWLARTGEVGCMWRAFAARDPRLAPVRDDPRIAALLANARLSPSGPRDVA